jgi:AraC-like DNA-binding protein
LGYRQGEWHAEVYLLMWMLKIVRLVDETFSPREIWCVSNATPERLEGIGSLTARPLFNRQCTGFPIPDSMLALPPKRRASAIGNPERDKARLWSMAPSDSAAGAIRQIVKAYANDRWLTIEEAADAVGLNVRTLQRQLRGEGKTYFVLADETRAEIARELLDESDLSLSEIAERTGYSDLSNFNRAFRRWSEVSPREFRAQRRGVTQLPKCGPVSVRKGSQRTFPVYVGG